MLLTRASIASGLDELCSRDGDLAQLRRRLGDPPLWSRRQGFPTLVHLILEQQVSLASARAAFCRLNEALDELTPSAFLELDAPTLRRVGFSRQKAGYCRGLAGALVAGDLDLKSLSRLGDEEVRTRLLHVRGIGAWTADCYLLMALRRPDVWPVGDLALARAVQEVKGLPSLPDAVELTEIGSAWHPWRAVAARLLWHYYLSKERAGVGER